MSDLNYIYTEGKRRLLNAIANGTLKVNPIVLYVKPGSGDVPLAYSPQLKNAKLRLNDET